MDLHNDADNAALPAPAGPAGGGPEVPQWQDRAQVVLSNRQPTGGPPALRGTRGAGWSGSVPLYAVI